LKEIIKRAIFIALALILGLFLFKALIIILFALVIIIPTSIYFGLIEEKEWKEYYSKAKLFFFTIKHFFT